MSEIPDDVLAVVDASIDYYDGNLQLLKGTQAALLGALNADDVLRSLVHSIRSRIKARDHLRKKLLRRYGRLNRDSCDFDIEPTKLFEQINDLVGVRLIHLHTKQIEGIDRRLRDVFPSFSYDIVEGPIARTWDDEYRQYFSNVGIETEPDEGLYTSVHYVIKSRSNVPVTAEVQVRTLMEEVWGEVSHVVNYPIESPHLPIREQVRALARSTSAATRLVDAIFASKTHLETD